MRLLCSSAPSLMRLIAQTPAVRDLFPPGPKRRTPGKGVKVGRTMCRVISGPKTGRELFLIRTGGLHVVEYGVVDIGFPELRRLQSQRNVRPSALFCRLCPLHR
jgi:hypothetical protein